MDRRSSTPPYSSFRDCKLLGSLFKDPTSSLHCCKEPLHTPRRASPLYLFQISLTHSLTLQRRGKKQKPTAMAKLVAVTALALIAFFLLESHTMVLAKATVQPADGQFYDPASYGQGSLKSYQCGGQCQRRCSQTQYKKPCLFFCNKCCAACLCVPPGFYGNKQVCPCYNNWKTKRGGPKCP